MSNYGIKCGVYVFRTNTNRYGGVEDKAGKFIEVKKVTKQFVTCEFYYYCDNKIKKDLRQHFYCSGKRKKMERNGTLFLWDFGIFDFKDADYYDMNGYFTSFELSSVEPEYENCDEPSDENIENIISESNFDEI